MRKYLQIYKATLLENLQYVTNIIIGFFSFLMMIFVLFNLWEYMYQDNSNYINGYSMQQMFWYVLITEGLWFGTRNKSFIYDIGDNIKSGNIAYSINDCCYRRHHKSDIIGVGDFFIFVSCFVIFVNKLKIQIKLFYHLIC